MQVLSDHDHAQALSTKVLLPLTAEPMKPHLQLYARELYERELGTNEDRHAFTHRGCDLKGLCCVVLHIHAQWTPSTFHQGVGVLHAPHDVVGEHHPPIT